MLKLVHMFYILQDDRMIGSNCKLLKCFFLKVEETLSCFLSASCGDQAGFVLCHIMCPDVCLESESSRVSMQKLVWLWGGVDFSLMLRKTQKWNWVNVDHVLLEECTVYVAEWFFTEQIHHRCYFFFFFFFSIEKTDFLIISSLLVGWLLFLAVECACVYLRDSIDSVTETQKNCQC